MVLVSPLDCKVPVSWIAGASAYPSLALSTTNSAQKMLVFNRFISSFIHFSFPFNPSCTNSRYHSPAQPPLVSLCIYSIKCKSLSTAFRALCDEMVIHFEVSWATFYVPLALPDLCDHHLLSSCLCSYCSLLLNCSLPPSVFPLKVLSFLQYPSSNITSPGKPSLIS